MRVLHFLLLIVFLSVCSTSGTYYLYNSLYGPQEEILQLEVTIAEYAGFNLEEDMLHLGSFPPGSGGFRYVSLTNGAVQRHFSTHVTGDVAPWVSVDPPSGILSPREQLNITVSVAVPEDSTFGSYMGDLHITFTT